MTRSVDDQVNNVVELTGRRDRTAHEIVSRGFDAVYDAYVPYVAAVGHKLLGRPEEVEDLVQDVFIEVLRSLHKLEKPGAIKGWLATIATRKAMRRLKRRKLRRFVGLDDYEGYVNATYEGVTAEQSALLGEVFARLDEFPALWRIIWSLKHLEGKNNVEIADMCDVSVTTVKRHLASTRQLLKEVFDDHRSYAVEGGGEGEEVQVVMKTDAAKSSD